MLPWEQNESCVCRQSDENNTKRNIAMSYSSLGHVQTHQTGCTAHMCTEVSSTHSVILIMIWHTLVENTQVYKMKTNKRCKHRTNDFVSCCLLVSIQASDLVSTASVGKHEASWWCGHNKRKHETGCGRVMSFCNRSSAWLQIKACWHCDKIKKACRWH